MSRPEDNDLLSDISIIVLENKEGGMGEIHHPGAQGCHRCWVQGKSPLRM